MLVFSVILVGLFSSIETDRNVRLIDHRSFIISVIQRTMNHVEERRWCNLKVHNIALNVSENVFGVPYEGTLEFTNGFVASVQDIDIIEHTIQQMWVSNADQTTSATPQATLRLVNVAVGFDIIARLSNGVERATGVFVYPLMQYQFFIAKNLFTNVITARVVGSVPNTTNRMRVFPVNDSTKVFGALFTWGSATASAIEWGDNIFAPIAQEVALNELEFPTICYNCNV